MKERNLAVLLHARALISSKPKSNPISPSDSHTKAKPKASGGAATKPDGQAEWVRFKTECVLLKGGRSR